MEKILLIVFAVNLLFPLMSRAQQIDPALTAAVTAQTLVLEDEYKKRKNIQETLIATQGAITGALEQVHSVEKKVLDYMANASAAMDNLFQLKEAAELVGVKIPTQLKKLATAVPQNLEGTAVATLTSNTLANTVTEMTSLSAFMSELVTSTSFSLGEPNSETVADHKRNVNLLSAAERYYIASQVNAKLRNIYRKLWLLTWQIENLGWKDALHRLNPQMWAEANYGKAIAERLGRQWKNTKIF